MIYDTYGYKAAMDFSMVFVGSAGLVYTFYNCGFDVYADDERDQIKLQHLKEMGVKLRGENKLKDSVKSK